MDTPRFQQFGIVGSGRVAQALALGFAPHSFARPLLWGRSSEHVRTAVAGIGGAAAHDLGQILARCDAVAIAVSDDALADVVADMAAHGPADHAPFVFHVSGRSGVAVLKPLRAAGALTAAVHPAMTFTGNPAGEVERMAGARFAITGSTPDAAARACKAVSLLGGVAVEIAEERRALYHAALWHASNHLVTLIAGASDALTEAGVDDPAALLAPLVRAALENSLSSGFAGLSGPLLRGDHHTIGDHLDALVAFSPGLLPAYRAMARATLDQLERRGHGVSAEMDRKLR